MTNKYLGALLVALFSANFGYSQTCNCDMSAGMDQEICEPGENVQLNGTATGEVVRVNWTPETDLSDPEILNPTVFVDQNTTFKLTTICRTNTFLPVINGSFENGFNSFTTDYTYFPVSGGFGPGAITVTNNPQLFNSGFAPCGDHTSGSGNMLLVDGSTTAGANIWCQTIPVFTNTYYLFSFWTATVFPTAPANLQVSVNGTIIGSYDGSSNTCQWEKLEYLFNTGGSSSITVCFSESTGIGFGNDFVIDDIVIQQACLKEDEVTIKMNPQKETNLNLSICEGQTVSVGGQSFSADGDYQVVLDSWKGCDSTVNLSLFVPELEALIETPEFLTCKDTVIDLDGSNSSSGAEIKYLWTTINGKIIGPNDNVSIFAGAPGTYILTITYNDGNIICSKTTSTVVTTDTNKPEINAGLDTVITCAIKQIRLEGSVSNPLSNYQILWTTTNGMIDSLEKKLNPYVSGAGTYFMTVINDLNGCSYTDTLVVKADPSAPKVIIEGDAVLKCSTDTLMLSGENSDQGSNFIFAWNTLDGNFVSDLSKLTVLINQSGTYSLIVTNTIDGCSSQTSYLVSEDKVLPIIDAGNIDTLTCIDTQTDLLGIKNLPDSLSLILWTSIGGNILSGANTLFPTVAKGGWYALNVTNIGNGCSAKDSVFIFQDANFPISDAGPDQQLTCDIQSVILSGPNTSQGTNISYIWTNALGDTIGLSQNINITTSGSYTLLVVDSDDGCESTDISIVVIDTLAPTADAGSIKLLTCINQQMNLDGSGSSTGNQFNLVWSTSNGIIIGNNNIPDPLVSAPGLYTLTITNNQNACTSTDAVTVNEDKEKPQAIFSGTTIIDCQSPNTTIKIEPVNTTVIYTYLWSKSGGTVNNPNNQSTLFVNAPGFYSVIVTNTTNGCTELFTQEILLNGELPIVDAGLDETITCTKMTVSIQGGFSYSGGNVDISWSGNAGQNIQNANSLNPQVSQAGIYTLLVADPLTGCKQTDQVQIFIDTVAPNTQSVLPDLLTCIIKQIALELSPILSGWSYIWTTIDGNIVSSNTIASVLVTEPGAYFVTITDAANGCQSIEQLIVSSDTLPPFVSAGPDEVLDCNEIELNLSGTTTNLNSLIIWTSANGNITSSSTNVNVTVDKAGTYVMTVTSIQNGCSATDSVDVEINDNVPSDAQLDIVPPGCNSLGTITVVDIVGGQSPFSYKLNQGAYQNNPSFVNLNPNSYTIQIVDANGCSLELVTQIPQAQELKVELPFDVTVEYGALYPIVPILNVPDQQIVTASWNIGDYLSCADCLYPIVTGTESKVYRLSVKDINGCAAFDDIRIWVIKDFGVYIPNAFSPNGDGLHDNWFVYGDPKEITNIPRVQVFNRWGGLVYERTEIAINDPSQGWDGKVGGVCSNAGVFVYYVELEYTDGTKRLFSGDINLMR